MKHFRKRIFSLALALALFCSSTPPSYAADGVASVMKIQRTAGTVSISNGKGKQVALIDNMNLYDGYGVKTDKASYAWISLDRVKLAMLDEASGASVYKQGRKLEILLDTGALFFNVAEPLEDDESLTIRTSTMAIGIRGTSGWIRIFNRNLAQVYILEGTVEVSVRDPRSGQTKTRQISGGETVTCIVYDRERPGDKCDILRARYDEGKVPGFVLSEVVNSPGFAEKIFEKSSEHVDLRKLTLQEAAEKLTADQVRTAQRPEFAAKKQEEKEQEKKPEPSAPDRGGVTESPGSSQDPPPSDDDANAGWEDPETDLDLTSVDGIMKGLQETGQFTVDGDFTVDKALTVPVGSTLTFNGEVTVASGVKVDVNGTVNANKGLTNEGTITVNSSNSLHVAEELKTQNAGVLTVSETGKVEAGTITGSVKCIPGAQVLGKEVSGANTSLVLDASGKPFELASSAWTAEKDPDGFYRYEYIVYQKDDSTGSLTIAGIGKMNNYGVKKATSPDGFSIDVTDAAWGYQMNEVIIMDGVTSIGNRAFYECWSLTNVEIPASVESIGDYAFDFCREPVSIDFQGSHTQWGDMEWGQRLDRLMVKCKDDTASHESLAPLTPEPTTPEPIIKPEPTTPEPTPEPTTPEPTVIPTPEPTTPEPIIIPQPPASLTRQTEQP